MRRTLILDLLRDEKGSAAEFALVVPLLMLLMFGTIDVGIYAWRINQAEKATQIGARWAAVTPPLATEIASTSYVNQTVGGVLVEQGDRIPVSALGLITCTSSGCSCTGTCPGSTFDSTAFASLSARMQQIYPPITDANIQVEYRGSGLGYAGDPNGPDIAPLITVRLTNMSYTPVSLSPFGGTVGLPDFAYSLTAEDLACVDPDKCDSN